jgi:Peptidase C13 family
MNNFIPIVLMLLLLPLGVIAQEDVRARVAAMPAGTPGQTDLFLISLAGDGKQWVFNREARLAIVQFDARYASAPRSLLLSNQPKPDLTTPIASRLTVETAISAMAEKMNRDEDILLLYLTSHGWKDGTVALSNGSNDLPPLSARDVDGWLRQANITHSVIVISACYSGSWAKPLQNPNRIILMAARRDRSSFGCSDDREFTFFGQALFVDGLRQGLALLPAFEQAKKVITGWESQGKLDPSEPQSALGARLLPVWQKLEATRGRVLESVAATSSTPPVPHCKSKGCNSID